MASRCEASDEEGGRRRRGQARLGVPGEGDAGACGAHGRRPCQDRVHGALHDDRQGALGKLNARDEDEAVEGDGAAIKSTEPTGQINRAAHIVLSGVGGAAYARV